MVSGRTSLVAVVPSSLLVAKALSLKVPDALAGPTKCRPASSVAVKVQVVVAPWLETSVPRGVPGSPPSVKVAPAGTSVMVTASVSPVRSAS